MSLTPTKIDWPAGPSSVEVSGDWDDWKEKIALSKQQDGSFSKEIPLPENKRVHYKFIVDGGWTTKEGAPTINDAGNVNNYVDVGPAPPAASAKESTAVAGGAAGAAALGAGAVGAAASQVNGHAKATTTPSAPAPSAPVVDKKSEPGQPIKQSADEDIRNSLPPALTTATHTAVPVVASAVATVTGADILRGTPQELPVSKEEAQKVQADAASSSQAAVVTDPTKASTENAKAGANAASNAALNSKSGTPVPVNEAGFAANLDPSRQAAGKSGGDAAAAVASAGHASSLPATSAPVKEAAKPDASKGLPSTPAQSAAAPVAPVTSSTKSAAPVAPVPSSTKSTAPAAAPAAAPVAAAPVAQAAPARSEAAPTASAAGWTKSAAPAAAPAAAPVAAPTTPVKNGTVKSRSGHHLQHGSESSSSHLTAGNGEGEGKERKRGSRFLGRIKSLVSPHSSPSK